MLRGMKGTRRIIAFNCYTNNIIMKARGRGNEAVMSGRWAGAGDGVVGLRRTWRRE